MNMNPVETYDKANWRMRGTIRSVGRVGDWRTTVPDIPKARLNGTQADAFPVGTYNRRTFGFQTPRATTGGNVQGLKNDVAHPFFVSRVSGAAKVTVNYGAVNNFVPTIGGTSIFTTPAPELTVATGTVYLKATVDGAGAVTAVVIENAASTPADTATLKYRTVASVTVTGGVVTAIGQSVTTSLALYLCNGTAIWEQA